MAKDGSVLLEIGFLCVYTSSCMFYTSPYVDHIVSHDIVVVPDLLVDDVAGLWSVECRLDADGFAVKLARTDFWDVRAAVHLLVVLRMLKRERNIFRLFNFFAKFLLVSIFSSISQFNV